MIGSAFPNHEMPDAGQEENVPRRKTGGLGVIRRLLTRQDFGYAFLVAAMLSAAVYLMALAPERVAVHWGIDGQPDGWGSPAPAFLILPVLSVFLWLLLLAAPVLDRFRENLVAAKETYGEIRFALAVFFGVMQATIMAAAFRPDWPVARTILVLLAGLFWELARVLPRLPRNETAGIRLPWTLSSDEVWRETHRRAASAFRLAAYAVAAAVFLPPALGFAVTMAAVLAAVVWSVAVAWRISRSRNE
jgi:uncharacterized membrane protein